MNRLLLLLAFAAASASVTGFAADSWVFQPSYYSHEPAQIVQIGPPQNFGGPYYTRPQGDYFRGGYRSMQSRLYTPGIGTDSVHVYESWSQFGAQY